MKKLGIPDLPMHGVIGEHSCPTDERGRIIQYDDFSALNQKYGGVVGCALSEKWAGLSPLLSLNADG